MKLNYKNVIFVGFAFFLISMFWQVYDTVIAKILIDSFGLSQTWSGVVLALDNIIAVILLPVFGKLSDDTNTKWGKRTPYIVIGTILAVAFVVVIGLIDKAQLGIIQANNIGAIEQISENEFLYNGVIYPTKEFAVAERTAAVKLVRQQNSLTFIAFIGVLFFVLLAMASFRTPAVSLMPDVTVKPLRSKANAVINLMGSAGGIIALGFLAFLANDYQSYILVFIVLAILMIVALGVFLFTVNERKLVAEMHKEAVEYGIETMEDIQKEEANIKEKMPKDVFKSFILILASIVFWFMGYNAATSKFSVYASNVLNTGYSIPLLVAQGAAIVSYLPIGMLASKLGRKKTILVGISELFLAFILATFTTSQTAFLMYAVMALAGIGWATINVNSYPMVVEMAKGSDIGKYTGFYYTASMSAQILTPVLSGILMDNLSWGMHVLFPYCAFFCALAFTTMCFVKHGDSKAIPTQKSSQEIFEETINALDD